MKINLFFILFCFFINASFAKDVSIEHKRIIDSVLKKCFCGDQVEDQIPFSTGFMSPGVYKVIVYGKVYVVRFNNQNQTLEQKEHELHAMQISAERGLAPKIIYGNANESIIVMEFINSINSSENFNPTNHENLKLLARNLRKLHEGPAFKNEISHFENMGVFERDLTCISHKLSEKSNIIKQAKALKNQLEADLRGISIKKPCHNDLNGNNLLYTHDGLHFIDWELAGQSDPFFDLVTPIVLFNMNSQQENMFLNFYFERIPSYEERIKIQKMKKVAMLFYGFGLVSISQKLGVEINEDEINALPSLETLLLMFSLHPHYQQDPFQLQCLGFAFLNKAIESD